MRLQRATLKGVTLNHTFFTKIPGVQDIVLPDDVGFLFSSDLYDLLVIAAHYDNRNYDSNVVDMSGIQIFYTETLRKYNMGVFQLGDGSTQLSTFFQKHGRIYLLLYSNFSKLYKSMCNTFFIKIDLILSLQRLVLSSLMKRRSGSSHAQVNALRST